MFLIHKAASLLRRGDKSKSSRKKVIKRTPREANTMDEWLHLSSVSMTLKEEDGSVVWFYASTKDVSFIKHLKGNIAATAVLCLSKETFNRIVDFYNGAR